MAVAESGASRPAAAARWVANVQGVPGAELQTALDCPAQVRVAPQVGGRCSRMPLEVAPNCLEREKVPAHDLRDRIVRGSRGHGSTSPRACWIAASIFASCGT
jgi:hypothetical protein